MLIIETGSGLQNAESYASVAVADAYHAGRLNTAWAALDTVTKEGALRRATEYLVGKYRDRWKGMRNTMTQALDWPRYNVQLADVGFGSIAAYVPANTVPVEVQNACCVLALIAATTDLAPPLERTVQEKTIGPIKTVFAQGSQELVRHPAVDMMLKPYLVGTATSGVLVRA
jgi:hypothetical protein